LKAGHFDDDEKVQDVNTEMDLRDDLGWINWFRIMSHCVEIWALMPLRAM
jgi:hypothetical protein